MNIQGEIHGQVAEAAAAFERPLPFTVYYRALENLPPGVHACFSYSETGNSVYFVNNYGFVLRNNTNDEVVLQLLPFQKLSNGDMDPETKMMMQLELPKVTRVKVPLVVPKNFLQAMAAANLLRKLKATGFEQAVNAASTGKKLGAAPKISPTLPFKERALEYLAMPKQRLQALRDLAEAANTTLKGKDTTIEQDELLLRQADTFVPPMTENMKAAVSLRLEGKRVIQMIIHAAQQQAKQLTFQIASSAVKEAEDIPEKDFDDRRMLTTILI